MADRFFFQPLKRPLPNAQPCALCGRAEPDMVIVDLADVEDRRLVHDTCLALYCEANGVKPPKSFVAYCIDKLKLRKLEDVLKHGTDG